MSDARSGRDGGRLGGTAAGESQSRGTRSRAGGPSRALSHRLSLSLPRRSICSLSLSLSLDALPLACGGACCQARTSLCRKGMGGPAVDPPSARRKGERREGSARSLARQWLGEKRRAGGGPLGFLSPSSPPLCLPCARLSPQSLQLPLRAERERKRESIRVRGQDRGARWLARCPSGGSSLLPAWPPFPASAPPSSHLRSPLSPSSIRPDPLFLFTRLFPTASAVDTRSTARSAPPATRSTGSPGATWLESRTLWTKSRCVALFTLSRDGWHEKELVG